MSNRMSLIDSIITVNAFYNSNHRIQLIDGHIESQCVQCGVPNHLKDALIVNAIPRYIHVTSIHPFYRYSLPSLAMASHCNGGGAACQLLAFDSNAITFPVVRFAIHLLIEMPINSAAQSVLHSPHCPFTKFI